LRATGPAHSLRRSTTAAAFVVALVVMLLPAHALAASNDLRNGSVTPSSGTTTTLFTFRVEYVGVSVTNAWVRLSGLSSGIATVSSARTISLPRSGVDASYPNRR